MLIALESETWEFLKLLPFKSLYIRDPMLSLLSIEFGIKLLVLAILTCLINDSCISWRLKPEYSCNHFLLSLPFGTNKLLWRLYSAFLSDAGSRFLSSITLIIGGLVASWDSLRLESSLCLHNQQVSFAKWTLLRYLPIRLVAEIGANFRLDRVTLRVVLTTTREHLVDDIHGHAWHQLSPRALLGRFDTCLLALVCDALLFVCILVLVARAAHCGLLHYQVGHLIIAVNDFLHSDYPLLHLDINRRVPNYVYLLQVV